MDENGIRATVKRRNSEQVADNKAVKAICHICSEKGKMQNCAVCNKGVCSSHSVVAAIQSQHRICEVCIREQALSKLSSQAAFRDNLAHNLSEIAAKRDLNTQTLNKVSAKIRATQRETQEKEQSHQVRTSELTQKLEKFKAQISSQSESLPDIKKQLLTSQMRAEVLRKENEEVSEKVINTRAQVDIMIKERTVLVGELNEVTDFIRNYVPVKIIKQIICNPCFQKVRHAFVQMFRPVVQVTDNVKPSAVHNPSSRKGVCTQCNVF